MRDLDGESQLLGILKTLIETVQQENRQLREDRADESLLARARREKLFDHVLPYLPALLTNLPDILTRLFPSNTCAAPVASPSTAHAPPPSAAPASQEAPPSAAQSAPHTSVKTPPAATPNAQKRHWFYPSADIGCGLNIDDLHANELTGVRHEVTCSGCLAQLRVDQERKMAPRTTLRLRSEKKIKPTDPTAPITGGPTPVHVCPQAVAMRVEEIKILSGPDWMIADVLVGRRSQFLQSGPPLPGSMFTPGGARLRFVTEPVQIGMDFTLLVHYVGPEAEGAIFEAIAGGPIVV